MPNESMYCAACDAVGVSMYCGWLVDRVCRDLRRADSKAGRTRQQALALRNTDNTDCNPCCNSDAIEARCVSHWYMRTFKKIALYTSTIPSDHCGMDGPFISLFSSRSAARNSLVVWWVELLLRSMSACSRGLVSLPCIVVSMPLWNKWHSSCRCHRRATPWRFRATCRFTHQCQQS